MTNSEYEKASVQAATGESLVRAADEKIKELESALEVARERRRELVNRYDLNKCEHEWLKFPMDSLLPGREVCKKCDSMK